MSLDITFQKEFTIEDIEKNTTIDIEFKDGNWWLLKNKSCILVKCYLYQKDDIDDLIKNDYEIIEEEGILYAVKDTHRILINTDKGKKNNVDGLTRYGMNDLSEIMDELVLTFQTKFITDEEEEMLYHDQSLNIDDLFTETTKKFGYTIENDKIKKSN